MSVTAQQAFDVSMDLIDERLSTGLFNEADIAVYKAKALGIINILQAELIEQGDIFSTHEISHYPVTNLIGEQFEVVAYEGTELIYEGAESVKAYYVEVDNDSTVYIEDFNGAWNTLETLTNTPTASGFTAYKGVITPSAGATKCRMRLAGSYYYRHVNRALYGVSFASDDDVPVYRPWVQYAMPSDFKKLVEIVNEWNGNYSKDPYYKWEGKSTLYLNYYYKGRVKVSYRPVPTAIAALSATLQVDDVTARKILPYGLAAHLLLEENQDMSNFFQQRYEELMAKERYNRPVSEESILDVYGGFGG